MKNSGFISATIRMDRHLFLRAEHQAAELAPDPAALKAKLKLLYRSCGNKDGLIRRSQDVHAYLKAHDVPHIWNVDDEGHTPKTWASNLYHFAQRIFR